MGLFYITGVSGSGKSAVERELRKLGYEAHDVDDPDIGGAYNNLTNQIEAVPPASERTSEWFLAHSWRIRRDRVEVFKTQSVGRPIFICGTAGNEHEVLDLFDEVVHLDIDEATLRFRISSRENNDFGKTASELRMILERHAAARRSYRQAQARVIDATQSVSEVVGEILDTLVRT